MAGIETPVPSLWSRRPGKRLYLLELIDTNSTVARLDAAVQRGAKLLDSIERGWYASVDLGTLNLSDANVCICGQVFAERAIELVSEQLAEEVGSGYELISTYSHEWLEATDRPLPDDIPRQLLRKEDFMVGCWGEVEVILDAAGDLAVDYYGFSHSEARTVKASDGTVFGTWTVLTAIWEMEILARQHAGRALAGR